MAPIHDMTVLYKTTLQYEIHELRTKCTIAITQNSEQTVHKIGLWVVEWQKLIVIHHLGRVVDQSRCLLL